MIKIEKLKILRENAGYKQIDIAKLLNITQSAISQWELGLCNPEYKYLIKLAEFYNCSIDEILGHTPQSSASDADAV